MLEPALIGIVGGNLLVFGGFTLVLLSVACEAGFRLEVDALGGLPITSMIARESPPSPQACWVCCPLLSV